MIYKKLKNEFFTRPVYVKIGKNTDDAPGMTTEQTQTIFRRFERSVEKYPDNPFLHIPAQASRRYCASAIDFTYGELMDQISVLIDKYNTAGYGAGHRIALLLENRAEFFQHFLALNALGACIVPLNPDSVADEMSYVITNSEVSLLVCLQDYSSRAEEVLSTVDADIKVYIAGSESIPAAAQLANDSPQLQGEAAAAAILYTSGTTGRPKGCVLSNEFFFCVGDWYTKVGGHLSMEDGCERAITPLPLFHTNALTWTMMAMMMNGGCIIQLDRFHPSTWWETVRESRATIVHYLGVMPAMLMGMATSELEVNKSIKFGFGAGVEPDFHAKFEQRFGFPLIEGWSMTETGAAGVVMCTEDPRHVGQRCMGRAAQGMEFRIVDDNGEEVEQGDAGEFLIRRQGKNPRYGFFTEYFGNPEATSEAWQDGWFHTGDVVREDADNLLYFIERKKNIIRRSGENIAAAEVERVLLEHPDIANCAVAPVPDKLRGEEVAACIVLKEGAPTGQEKAEQVVRFCLDKMSYYKPPGYIRFVDELPLTSTQKIQRGELRKLCEELMQSGGFIVCTNFKKKPRT